MLWDSDEDLGDRLSALPVVFAFALHKQEQQARAEEAEAEQQLRDQQVKLDGLNDLLDRYTSALEEIGRK